MLDYLTNGPEVIKVRKSTTYNKTFFFKECFLANDDAKFSTSHLGKHSSKSWSNVNDYRLRTLFVQKPENAGSSNKKYQVKLLTPFSGNPSRFPRDKKTLQWIFSTSERRKIRLQLVCWMTGSAKTLKISLEQKAPRTKWVILIS